MVQWTDDTLALAGEVLEVPAGVRNEGDVFEARGHSGGERVEGCSAFALAMAESGLRVEGPRGSEGFELGVMEM